MEPASTTGVTYDMRKPKEAFLKDLLDAFGDIDGVEMTADRLLRQWHRRKAMIPLPGDREFMYLFWLVMHTPNLSEAERTEFALALQGGGADNKPLMPTASLMFTLDAVLTHRLNEMDEVAYANGNFSEGQELDDVMEADRLRERDFIRCLAALKRNQVDILDETGRISVEQKEAQRLAYLRACNHRYLDDLDNRGRKRPREDKERIVTAWLNSGPQPWTRDDVVWRRADKLQRYTDAFITAIKQSELIAAEWKGHPIVPPSDAGEPARFGRRDSEKRWYTPKPYIPWPPIHYTRPVVSSDAIYADTGPVPKRPAPAPSSDLQEIEDAPQ